jgi:hypothetical protein
MMLFLEIIALIGLLFLAALTGNILIGFAALAVPCWIDCKRKGDV